MKKEHEILIVDDEARILTAVKRLFRKESLVIHTTTSPDEALDMVQSHPIALVVSDQRMPAMQGHELLGRVRDHSPETIRILLTGYSDIEATKRAINKGGIYKFISKPWDDETFRLTVLRALEQYDLVAENKRLLAITRKQNDELKQLNGVLEHKVARRTQELQKTNILLEKRNDETIELLARMLDMRSPLMGNHGQRVATAVKYMATEMKLKSETVKEYFIAALLHDTGMIGLPDDVVVTNYRNTKTVKVEKLKQHCAIGEACLGLISGFASVAKMVRSHHECYDGSGYPDQLAGENIPLGSRLIAIADAYDEMINNTRPSLRLKPEQALKQIKAEAGSIFDPNLIQLFEDYIGVSGVGQQDELEMNIRPQDLVSGMVLSRKLFTSKKMLIACENTVITEAFLEKLANFQSTNPIIDNVYVYRKKTKEYRDEQELCTVSKSA